MKWDPLIHWMSHVGEGSWASFKRMVVAHCGANDDVAAEVRRVRIRLSDLGYAEFFIGETGRWRVFRPLLAATESGRNALLCGARTPELVRAIRAAARKHSCEVYELAIDGLFSSVHVVGEVERVAATVGIDYEVDIALRLATELVPLGDLVRNAQPRSRPRNWTPKSFDFRELRWVDGEKPNTVVEMTSRYQERVYLLQRGGDVISLPKREALYAAAAARRAALARYEPATRQLSVPIIAPLPEPFARAACVAGGRPSVLRHGAIVYEEVPVRLATVLLVGLDHLPPRFHFCDPRRRPSSRGPRSSSRSGRRR
jgi:hypothetical protein